VENCLEILELVNSHQEWRCMLQDRGRQEALEMEGAEEWRMMLG